MGKITVEYFISTFGTMNHPTVGLNDELDLRNELGINNTTIKS